MDVQGLAGRCDVKLAFRVDASLEIGTGHLMRCLTLANELRSRGATCQFICRNHPGNLIALIQAQGFDVTGLASASSDGKFESAGIDALYAQWLGEDSRRDAKQTLEIISVTKPDWLVVDHYAIDANWEKNFRSHVPRMMVIDDLANRAHECDLLLDQNFYVDMASRYSGLLPSGCKLLLGPTHVLLRPEFIHARDQLRQRDGWVKRILVFFGGSDITNQTQKTLEALGKLNRTDIAVDVVIGSASPYRTQLQEMTNSMSNVALHCQVSNMAELIAHADLGIGAGGAAMWERCYLGLPTITVTFADNQVRTTEDVAGLGAIKYVGRCNSFTAVEYEQAISEALDAPETLLQLSKVSLGLVRPGAREVADLMENFA